MKLWSNTEKLIERKRELGWTNQKLSKESGVPIGTLNKIFTGKTRYPRDKTIDALVQAMGMACYPFDELTPARSVIRETSNYVAGPRGQSATVSTFFSLPRGINAELIDGKLYYTEEPTPEHQRILLMMASAFYSYFTENKREYHLFVGPCDVCLDNDEYTMVKPDLFIYKGQFFAGHDYCMGAPEFVSEVVSETDSSHDYERKRFKYQEAGVKEYWIVDPGKRRVVVYVFELDAIPAVYTFEDEIKPYLFPDIEIRLR